jgi:hypothetical protein
MPGSDANAAKPRRFSFPLPRPLWVGLATAVLVVCGAGLRIGVHAYRQKVATQEIERLGGRIYRVSQIPYWLSGHDVEFEFLEDVEAVVLTGSDDPDAAMRYARDFGELRALNLWGTRVTDAGLQNIESLTNLVALDAAYTQLSDAGLIHLKRLTKLEKLKLHRTRVTDAGVTELQRALPGLTICR